MLGKFQSIIHRRSWKCDTVISLTQYSTQRACNIHVTKGTLLAQLPLLCMCHLIGPFYCSIPLNPDSPYLASCTVCNWYQKQSPSVQLQNLVSHFSVDNLQRDNHRYLHHCFLLTFTALRLNFTGDQLNEQSPRSTQTHQEYRSSQERRQGEQHQQLRALMTQCQE